MMLVFHTDIQYLTEALTVRRVELQHQRQSKTSIRLQSPESKRKTIPEYTKKYAGFIKREIDMIKPDIIICCGSGLRHLLGEIGICSPRYTVIEVYHPSYRISDKRHLEKLKAAFDEISAE